jgi:hypothetical protein
MLEISGETWPVILCWYRIKSVGRLVWSVGVKTILVSLTKILGIQTIDIVVMIVYQDNIQERY